MLPIVLPVKHSLWTRASTARPSSAVTSPLTSAMMWLCGSSCWPFFSPA
jgi:hypothetical protein